jgi:5-methylcytosine-specific restriction endonuclease McrA
MDNLKQCTKCKEWKDRSRFFKNSQSPDGLHPSCRECKANYRNANLQYISDKNKAYREKNKERLNQYTKEWREKNKDYNRAIKKAYYDKNQDKILEEKKEQYRQDEQERSRKLEYSRRWRKDNPDKRRIQSIRRRAAKAKSTGAYTLEEWQALCSFYGNACLCCGTHANDTPEGKLTPDHITPLSKGGSNSISNIQPLCLKCNISKNAKTIDYRPHLMPLKQLRLF